MNADISKIPPEDPWVWKGQIYMCPSRVPREEYLEYLYEREPLNAGQLSAYIPLAGRFANYILYLALEKRNGGKFEAFGLPEIDSRWYWKMLPRGRR
jgi:hypothetical protein